MRRILPFILIAALLLSGCSMLAQGIREPVTFYYLRQNPEELRSGEAMFVGEIREAAGHRHDLNYLMALYLIGPTGEELCTPVPRGTQITSAILEGDTVHVTMSDTAKTMTDIEYALACTCISMTCLELTTARLVTITSGERSLTMGQETLVLQDHTAEPTTEDTQ